jgi:hypothetical protein
MRRFFRGRNHRHLFHSKNICPLLFLTSRLTSALFPFPTSPQYVSLICDPFALDNLCIDNYAEIRLDKVYCDINSLIESAVSTVAPSNKITRKKPKLNVMNSDIYNAIKEKKQAYCIA